MSLSGQVIAPRDSLNHAFYGKPVTPVDILVKHNVSNPAAAPLQAALAAAAK